ncbi:transposase [Streptomyces achromogenes]|uniref:transposase n=1 Tax=Streptomyces achromogenes TaxID=67255 RepID=UPI0036F50B8D
MMKIASGARGEVGFTPNSGHFCEEDLGDCGEGALMGTARYSEEFKRDAATLVESSGWRISSLARERDVNPESLRQWIARSRAAASPSGTGGECPLHQEEREELRRLCKEDALDTLRTLLFEFDSRSTIRDKEQLHRMLEKELWIFEDEYTHGVSEIGTDDGAQPAPSPPGRQDRAPAESPGAQRKERPPRSLALLRVWCRPYEATLGRRTQAAPHSVCCPRRKSLADGSRGPC